MDALQALQAGLAVKRPLLECLLPESLSSQASSIYRQERGHLPRLKASAEQVPARVGTLFDTTPKSSLKREGGDCNTEPGVAEPDECDGNLPYHLP